MNRLVKPLVNVPKFSESEKKTSLKNLGREFDTTNVDKSYLVMKPMLIRRATRGVFV